MPGFKHILFPVDFSEQNNNIAGYVVCMARRYGARVTMLHAVEIPAVGYPDGMYTGFDFQGLLAHGKQRVESFLLNQFNSVPTTRLMHEGDPAWVIGQYAEKEKVDLIMMPTHGFGP